MFKSTQNKKENINIKTILIYRCKKLNNLVTMNKISSVRYEIQLKNKVVQTFIMQTLIDL